MLLIMRHFESEKNLRNQFSSTDDLECLTIGGKLQGIRVAETIDRFVKENSLTVTSVYCANSERAKLTALYLADRLGVSIKAYDNLRSNNSGSLKGKNEIEAQKSNPIFMKQLKLFRAGIFSSYEFVKVLEREDKHAFEQRVIQCINNIVACDTGTLQIIVLHHSSLTAAVIHFAREFYHYPVSFYGHVACELGNCYLINQDDILLCNEPASELLKIKVLCK